MAKQVLVAYGSKYGATAEIAQKIGDVLREAGLEAEVKSAKHVGDLSSYDAVVLGSAAYAGGWRKEATRLLKNNVTTLTEKMVWIFSSGPTGEGDPVELVKGWKHPSALATEIEAIAPRDITVFHGAMLMEKMNFIEKFVIGKIGAPAGDFRDWDAIVAWATGIANDLKA